MLVNGLIYRFISSITTPANSTKKSSIPYEPIHLHCFVPRNMDTKRVIWNGRVRSSKRAPKDDFGLNLNTESFRFILEQVPTIQTLEFSGWGDPLAHPELSKLINQAYAFTGITSHVISSGYYLSKQNIDALVSSKLKKLSLVLNGHKPSSFAMNTLEPASLFLPRLSLVQRLINTVQQSASPFLSLEFVFITDSLNYQEIPEIIKFAEELGMQSIRFDNHIEDYNRYQSMYSLYEDNQKALSFIEDLKQQPQAIKIQWPRPLLRSCEKQRTCQDPFSVVSITPDMHVSPCSQNQFVAENNNLLWENSFWNNDAYTMLRKVYQNPQETLPIECHNCPKNLNISSSGKKKTTGS